MQPTTQTPEGLSERDVICDRTRQATQHVGNHRYQALIRQTRPAYQASSIREEKSSMTRAIIHTVQNEWGGRFVKFDTETQAWKVIENNHVIHDKVAHALRSGKEDQSERRRKQRQECKSTLRQAQQALLSNESEASNRSSRSNGSEQNDNFHQVFIRQQQLITSSLNTAPITLHHQEEQVRVSMSPLTLELPTPAAFTLEEQQPPPKPEQCQFASYRKSSSQSQNTEMFLGSLGDFLASTSSFGSCDLSSYWQDAAFDKSFFGTEE